MALTSSREASAYIIYMMLGSYFKKAVCTSKGYEDRLKIAYSEQKRDNQVKNEERCENYIEQRMVPELPSEIFEDMVEVTFIDDPKTNILVIFKGFDWKMEMWAEENKGYINYYHKFSHIKIEEE